MAQGALPGFRDFYPEQFAERAHIMAAWREVARRYAFVEYDGPPLEPLELYTKKSGDEIVGQLYEFKDKGDRQVTLRPEMTPTFARMVGAKASALRKPVRWFSVPQLFRYERQQRGRLREHFQLNVDIVGEPTVSADAELLAVALDIMRELELSSADVRARVSDRRLLTSILHSVAVTDEQLPGVFGVIDKWDRVPAAASMNALHELGIPPGTVSHIVDLVGGTLDIDTIEARYAVNATSAPLIANLREYLDRLGDLGVRDWVDLDFKIVRGLAYYTGIVFELFDSKRELRAICGGGRYDNLLASLGGADLPALGFGMGDVVLSELLRDRGLLPSTPQAPQVWVGSDSVERGSDVRRVATALRRQGVSAEYALRVSDAKKPKDAARRAGAGALLLLHGEGGAEHSWSPADVPDEWKRCVTAVIPSEERSDESRNLGRDT